MPTQLTCYHAFIASPGGLAAEREVFRDTLLEYNRIDGLRRGLYMNPVGWEEALGGVGRPQSRINVKIEECDFFVMMLHDRWGSAPGVNEDGTEYSAATEEEFNVALRCLDDERPMQRIVVFFKGIEADRMAEPDDQVGRVLEFREYIEQHKLLLYEVFDTADEFGARLDHHVHDWAFAHERQPAAPAVPAVVTKSDLGMPSLRPTAVLDDLEEAEAAADGGRVAAAERLYCQLIAGEPDAQVLISYGDFLMRLGRGTVAEGIYQRVVDDLQHPAGGRSVAMARLGKLAHLRGDGDRAKILYDEANGVAAAAGEHGTRSYVERQLGALEGLRGNREAAQAHAATSLKLAEQSGDDEMVADALRGLAYAIKSSKPDAARAHLVRSLGIAERRDDTERRGKALHNLGILDNEADQLDSARSRFEQGLDLFARLDDREWIANALQALSIVDRKDGDIISARARAEESLAMRERLGDVEGIVGSLYSLMQLVDDDLEAERIGWKALDLSEDSGFAAGITAGYNNLATIAQRSGDLAKALELAEKAVALAESEGDERRLRQAQATLRDIQDAMAGSPAVDPG